METSPEFIVRQVAIVEFRDIADDSECKSPCLLISVAIHLPAVWHLSCQIIGRQRAKEKLSDHFADSVKHDGT